MNRYGWMTVTFFIMVGINALANARPLNGQRTGEISDSLNVLFTPAGYVFSIWSLIYLLVFIWLIMQWIRKETTTLQAVLFSTSSIYLGWISVATIANFSFTMKDAGISLGISEVYGTILLMFVAMLIAIASRFISRDVFFHSCSYGHLLVL